MPEFHWQKIVTRPLTEAEKAEFAEQDLQPEFIFDCVMPADGERILIARASGDVDIDTCRWDGDAVYLEDNEDWDGTVAWAGIPPYTEEA